MRVKKLLCEVLTILKDIEECLALIAIAVRPRADLLERAMFLIFSVAVYMAFAINSHMNIGLRHILPIYPFLIVLGAAGAHQLLA